ncbi:hypothetical protein [Paracoccus sanguinis]|uniref:Uncharacterized protein n=1 Tax=Paracoccus sanguinis TaxID=1545044 RepID=A0A1H2SNH2_9RHOB|nr:hypothetical protein [Paracoccus sanguinis]SDW32634.1 hypothetical protein SAMN05444276_101672 [Paracoccus sanguinis]
MTKGQGYMLIGVAMFILASIDQPHHWGAVGWSVAGLLCIIRGAVAK